MNKYELAEYKQAVPYFKSIEGKGKYVQATIQGLFFGLLFVVFELASIYYKVDSPFTHFFASFEFLRIFVLYFFVGFISFLIALWFNLWRFKRFKKKHGISDS